MKPGNLVQSHLYIILLSMIKLHTDMHVSMYTHMHTLIFVFLLMIQPIQYGLRNLRINQNVNINSEWLIPSGLFLLPIIYSIIFFDLPRLYPQRYLLWVFFIFTVHLGFLPHWIAQLFLKNMDWVEVDLNFMQKTALL